MKRRLAALLLGVAAAGCGAQQVQDLLDTLVRDCSSAGKTAFVADTLEDIYLWYRELPDVDADDYDSPEAYLEAVRYRPLDESFSYIVSKEEDEAFRARSEYVGFGFGMRAEGSELAVTHVYPGSPAAGAGLGRGSRILEIGGRSVADLLASGQLDEALGAPETGVQVSLRFQARDGEVRDVVMRKAVIDVPPVGATRVFTDGGRVVGYIELANFTEPTRAALDQAFTTLERAGATELVLDVRYNGGGLVSVARHLAGLVGGSRTRGAVLARLVHNDKNRGRDQTLDFPAVDHALGLSRIFVITTGSSASASELMINGLRPHFTVVQVGSRSYGKPVGQYSYEFCDRVLYPVAFTVRNSRDEGDYFEGLAPECEAPDDLGYDLGDPAEGSLATALGYLRSGGCASTAARAARDQARGLSPRDRQPAFGHPWRELVGAW